jgi:hypothetical protein
MNPTDHRGKLRSLLLVLMLHCLKRLDGEICGAWHDDVWCAEGSMNIASAIAFDTAEREYNDAWNAPSSTRFELPPVDVNKAADG